MTPAHIINIPKARQCPPTPTQSVGGPDVPSVPSSPPTAPTGRAAHADQVTQIMEAALFELRYGPLKLYGNRWRGYREGRGFRAETINALEDRGLVSRWESYGPYRQIQVTLRARALNPAIGD